MAKNDQDDGEEKDKKKSKGTPSSAPGTSFSENETVKGDGDPPTFGSKALPNPKVEGPEHEEPYYPSGTGSITEKENEKEKDKKDKD